MYQVGTFFLYAKDIFLLARAAKKRKQTATLVLVAPLCPFISQEKQGGKDRKELFTRQK